MAGNENRISFVHESGLITRTCGLGKDRPVANGSSASAHSSAILPPNACAFAGS
jgi:hypothetical protein